MNPFKDRPKVTTNVVFSTGEDMSLEVTVTIKHGAGYGAPWTVVKGSPGEVAGFLGIEEFDGKGSTLALQTNKVAAYVAGEFDKLNPGKG